MDSIYLDLREKHIIEMYMNGLTLAEIGAKYQISRERVRQILRRAGTPGKLASTIRRVKKLDEKINRIKGE